MNFGEAHERFRSYASLLPRTLDDFRDVARICDPFFASVPFFLKIAASILDFFFSSSILSSNEFWQDIFGEVNERFWLGHNGAVDLFQCEVLLTLKSRGFYSCFLIAHSWKKRSLARKFPYIRVAILQPDHLRARFHIERARWIYY